MARLFVMNDYESMSARTAAEIVRCIQQKPDALLCFAAGDTPRRAAQMAARELNNAAYNIHSFRFAGLDEWVGIPPENTGSCQYFFRREWLHPLQVPAERFHLFNALSPDLEKECQDMDQWIQKGNGIDLMMVGLGMNGHIGFNEPGLSWDLLSHVAQLDDTTLMVGQKYFQQQTKVDRGISIGLGWLKQAKNIILLANGIKKAPIVKKMWEGEVSNEVPASILQLLPQAQVFLDKEAASLLQQTQGHEVD